MIGKRVLHRIVMRIMLAYDVHQTEAVEFLNAPYDKMYVFSSGKVYFPGDTI